MKVIMAVTAMAFAINGFAMDLKSASQDNSIIKYNPKNPGQPGICTEISKELASLGVKLTGLESSLPLLRVEAGLESGDLEAFLCILKNAEREKRFNYFETKLYDINHVLVTVDGEKDEPKSYDELKSVSKSNPVLVPNGSSLVKVLEANGITVDSGAKDEDAALKKLLAGRAKFGYFQDLSILMTIRSGGSEFAKIKILPTKFKSEPQYAAYSKKLSSEKAKTLSEAIQKVQASGAIDKIISKYR